MHFWNSTLNSGKRLWGLSGRDRRLLLSALVLVPLTVWMLELFGFSRVYAALGRILRSASPLDSDDESARHRARTVWRLVQRAARHSPVAACCLPVSLVAWALLRFEGLPAVLQLGVRTSDHEFEAHAWIECGSLVLNDAPGTWYALPPLPSTGPRL